jgi:pimeloyl-ACP methyl ester carboxylesterase
VHFARAITYAVKGARLRIIEGAAHALIYDEPQGFNGAVLDFLATLSSSPSRPSLRPVPAVTRG